MHNDDWAMTNDEVRMTNSGEGSNRHSSFVNRTSKELGEQGEELAVRFLIRKRYRILARNWRDRGGEIDIVARDGGTLVFVEVKTRTSDTFALPVESVGYEKQRKLRRLAERYTMRSGMSECEARFDVVSVIMRGAKPEIEHLTNAF
jgi:putative endonuclease